MLHENSWNKFKSADQFGGRTLDDTHHRSIVLLGLERGYLGKITSPIHKFILNNSLTTQDYKSSLNETWLFAEEGLERNKIFKIFIGKLSELCYANYLEDNGYKIKNLEAWGGPFDISASKKGKTFDFEAKFIGLSDDNFANIVDELAGNPKGYSWDANEANDYLLLRIYESAKQLEGSGASKKFSVMIIDKMTDFKFKIKKQDDWLKPFNKPRFRFYNDTNPFFQEQIKKYPDIMDDLESTLSTLSSIQIYNFEIFEFEEFRFYDNP
ncbi:MAG: hypothetical protein E2O43_04465 [Nitrospina sp.]|nr:MAG: hypothetical protein E2O43_04465 [Nitrospina sp.]